MIETIHIAMWHGAAVSLVAFVFAVFMANNETPLSWWFQALTMLPKWVGKPLGLCEVCFAGQLALWSSIIGFGWPHHFHSWAYVLTAIGMASTLTYFLSKAYRWTESNL